MGEDEPSKEYAGKEKEGETPASLARQLPLLLGNLFLTKARRIYALGSIHSKCQVSDVKQRASRHSLPVDSTFDT